MHLGNSFYRQVVLKIPGMTGGNQGTQFTFEDQADIRYARTLYIEAYFASALTYARPEHVLVLNDTFAPSCTLVLETNDPDDLKKSKGQSGRFTSTTQTQKWLPLTAINRVQSQSGPLSAPFTRYLMPYKDLYITWQKSFVDIFPALGNTGDVAIVLGVWYTFIDDKGAPIQRV